MISEEWSAQVEQGVEMADRVIVVTPDQLKAGHFVSDEMINDLLGVAAIPMDAIQKLADALQAEKRVLDIEGLGQLTAGILADEGLASAAASTVQNLRSEFIANALDAIREWREFDAPNKERIPDDSLAAIETRLPQLVQDYPSIARMRKASRLQSILGNRFDSVEFICDARPVFDQEREQIEGLIATTTMKLSYERQNGSDDEIELVMRREQIQEIVIEAQKALKKLAKMEASFSQWLDVVED